MPDIQLVALKCKIKPQRPEDCGYLNWDLVNAAMVRQKERPLAERLRPCVPCNAWLYYASCRKCKNSLWELTRDGVPARAVVRRILGDSVELYVPERHETLEYSAPNQKRRMTSREKPLHEQGPEME